jgi:hypothetical protein
LEKPEYERSLRLLFVVKCARVKLLISLGGYDKFQNLRKTEYIIK